MIGLLKGKIIEKRPPFLLLDVNGVGYEIQAPMTTFYELQSEGSKAILFIHLAIRDDAHILYGFQSQTERNLFRELLKISGIGGKVALAILSGMTAEEFKLIVEVGDSQTLTKLPGVGKKTAERLIIEMRDRLPKILKAEKGGNKTIELENDSESIPIHDAISALISLGYKASDAVKMTKSLDLEGKSTEELIRLALKKEI
tara:strand:- start:34 stop:636 length:603 start_codon:yes stop_codon:yes gene_type:complete